MNILSATLNYLSVFYCMLRQWVTALEQPCASSPPCHQVWQVVPEALHFNFSRGLWQELIIWCVMTEPWVFIRKIIIELDQFNWGGSWWKVSACPTTNNDKCGWCFQYVQRGYYSLELYTLVDVFLQCHKIHICAAVCLHLSLQGKNISFLIKLFWTLHSITKLSVCRGFKGKEKSWSDCKWYLSSYSL